MRCSVDCVDGETWNVESCNIKPPFFDVLDQTGPCIYDEPLVFSEVLFVRFDARVENIKLRHRILTWLFARFLKVKAFTCFILQGSENHWPSQRGVDLPRAGGFGVLNWAAPRPNSGTEGGYWLHPTRIRKLKLPHQSIQLAIQGLGLQPKIWTFNSTNANVLLFNFYTVSVCQKHETMKDTV